MPAKPSASRGTDNDFWFVFEQPAPRRAVVVVDDPSAARPLQLAASISPVPLLECAAEVVTADQLAGVDWDQVSLLLWQAPLPDPAVSKQVRAFVDRGGSAIFFPAHVPGAGEMFGIRWTSWVDQKAEVPVESWRGMKIYWPIRPAASRCRRPASDQEVLRSRGRGHAAGHVTGWGTACGAGDDQSRGSLLLRHHAGAGRFDAGDQRRRLLRFGSASDGGGAAALGNTRQLIAGEAPPDDPTA